MSRCRTEKQESRCDAAGEESRFLRYMESISQLIERPWEQCVQLFNNRPVVGFVSICSFFSVLFVHLYFCVNAVSTRL